MKIKRQLRQANEEINKQILEDGNDLYNALIIENNISSENVVKRKNKKLIWAFSLASVIVLVIVLGIILGISFSDKNSPIQYVYENAITVKCDISELNNADDKININTENFTYSCYRVYDKLYDDVLFYCVKLSHNQDLLEGQISIVNNKNYIFKDNYDKEIITGTYKGYKMTYSVRLDELNVLPMNNFFGCVEVGDAKVYFEFSGVAMAHTTPNEFLDETLIIQ